MPRPSWSKNSMGVSGMFSCSHQLVVVQEGRSFVSSILVSYESTQEEFLAPPSDWPKGQSGRRGKTQSSVVWGISRHRSRRLHAVAICADCGSTRHRFPSPRSAGYRHIRALVHRADALKFAQESIPLSGWQDPATLRLSPRFVNNFASVFH